MTPADVLSAAAYKLEALASKVPAGPWGAEGRCVEGLGGESAWQRDVVFVGDDGEGGASTPRVAEYIAAMNPLVGRALVSMLRAWSGAYSRETRHFHEMWNEAQRERMIGDKFPGFNETLALARLIIGGES